MGRKSKLQQVAEALSSAGDASTRLRQLAAECVELEERFDLWVAKHGKRELAGQRIVELALRQGDAYDALHAAWQEYTRAVSPATEDRLMSTLLQAQAVMREYCRD